MSSFRNRRWEEPSACVWIYCQALMDLAGIFMEQMFRRSSIIWKNPVPVEERSSSETGAAIHLNTTVCSRRKKSLPCWKFTAEGFEPVTVFLFSKDQTPTVRLSRKRNGFESFTEFKLLLLLFSNCYSVETWRLATKLVKKCSFLFLVSSENWNSFQMFFHARKLQKCGWKSVTFALKIVSFRGLKILTNSPIYRFVHFSVHF